MNCHQNQGTISDLVGEPLSGVAFVQDYVEFHFDGKIVRALTQPSVAIGGALFTYPRPGSRDALCSLIGYVVDAVEVTDDERLEIVLSKNATIRIPLRVERGAGPEAVHFVPGPNEPIEVW